MAISEYNYIPTYIKRTIANKPKDVITHSYWNELFNLLINQGDHTAKELGNILNHFTTVITGAASDTAAAIAEEHEYASAFEIHLSTNANPITADKTFAEIRQAIVDKREILLWVSEVQCLKPTCKAFEHTITLTVFDYSPAGPVVRADVYECYDENEWFIKQGIELAKQNNVGDIRELTTTHKHDLVAAINEVKGSTDTKQDIISDLETIRTGAAKGATALQSVPSTYRTALAQDVIDSDLGDRIEVIEGKEAGWNSKYVKPTSGIPKTDLANDVQASLGKADTALQSVPSTYRTASEQDTIDSGKVDKVTGKGLSTNDYTDAAKAKVDAIPENPKYTDTLYDDTVIKKDVSFLYDTKQDKLIAGENITIAADGKTISATGGGSSLTNDDIIDALYETGIINPVTDSGGKILLAADNNILTL